MRAAFASTGQAAAFASLLLVFLLLPLLLREGNLPSRDQIYSAMLWDNGAYPYIHQQIFEEKGDIDIAFVGPSHLWQDIHTPYVQEQLSKRLGHPAVVRSLCWGGGGFDALYFITQDLLEHRKVRMLVIYDSTNDNNQINDKARSWFRWGDNAKALNGLPLQIKANYYLASIIGMPRVLLELIRSNFPVDPTTSNNNYWATADHADDFTSSLGSLVMRAGFGLSTYAEHAPFEEYTPSTSTTSADVLVYSPETRDSFNFKVGAVPEWQLHFARKFADLSEDRGCKLVLLHLPTMSEARSPVIQEKAFWPDIMHSDLTMVGIIPARLFAGLTDEDLYKLYGDMGHMNKNGQFYFTPLVTPSLLDIYEGTTHH